MYQVQLYVKLQAGPANTLPVQPVATEELFWVLASGAAAQGLGSYGDDLTTSWQATDEEIAVPAKVSRTVSIWLMSLTQPRHVAILPVGSDSVAGLSEA